MVEMLVLQFWDMLMSDIKRSKERIKKTGEIFTPPELVEMMMKDIEYQIFKDPKTTFIDPSAGDGNILNTLKTKLLNYHTEYHILNHMLYSVELMSDNHKELCERLGVPTDHPHYVCDDALKYHYGFNGRTSNPITLDNF